MIGMLEQSKNAPGRTKQSEPFLIRDPFNGLGSDCFVAPRQDILLDRVDVLAIMRFDGLTTRLLRHMFGNGQCGWLQAVPKVNGLAIEVADDAFAVALFIGLGPFIVIGGMVL